MTKNISLDNVMLKVQMHNRHEASITWEDRNAHILVVVNVDFMAGRIQKIQSSETLSEKKEVE